MSSDMNMNISTATTSITASPAAAATARPTVRFQNQPSVTILERASSITSQEEREENAGKKGKSKRMNKETNETPVGNNTNETSGNHKNKKQSSKPKQPMDTRKSSRSPDQQRRSPTSSAQDESERIPHSLMEKKRPMRPVEDILNRIKHDPLIQTNPEAYLKHFIIAYIDRVFGDQEIAFEEFFTNTDFKDIPLHRISYLRYCDEIIWSRANKYDAVYGSSNSNLTLQHWLDSTDELYGAQQLRWAHMLAEEREQERNDAKLLKALDASIVEQKETIAAMQGDFETRSNATSGFDFGDDRDELMEDEPLDEVEEETQMKDVPKSIEVIQPIVEPKPASSGVPITSATATPSTAATAFGSVESLPQRDRGSRSSRASRTTTSTQSRTIHTSAAPVEASRSSISSESAATSTSIPVEHSSTTSHPLREDDANISFTISLFDPSTQRIRKTNVLRISLAHFDWPFLRKRIAGKLNLTNGVNDVKRMYIHSTDPTHPDRVKLTENNFRSVLKEGITVILMAETDLKSNPAAIFDQPRQGSEDETRKDIKSVASIPVTSSTSASTAVNVSKGPSSKSQLALAVNKANDRPNYFISLRITNPAILSTVETIQQALVKYNPGYKAFLVEKGTFHITVSLLCIKDDADINTAVAILKANEEKIRQILQAPNDSSIESSTSAANGLIIRGLSSFGGKVLFADLPRGPGRARLNQVAGLLSDAFELAGVGCSQNKRTPPPAKPEASSSRPAKGATVVVETTSVTTEVESFTPHLTLAKMSRVPPAKGGKKKESKFQGGKRKPQFQKQNTGMTDQDGDANMQITDEPASSDVKPALNPFGALSHSDSTTSAASTTSHLASESEGDLSSNSIHVTHINPSTSVIRRIEPASYAAWESYDFGLQEFVTLDLCAMGGKKQPDGYYQVKGMIPINKL